MKKLHAHPLLYASISTLASVQALAQLSGILHIVMSAWIAWIVLSLSALIGVAVYRLSVRINLQCANHISPFSGNLFAFVLSISAIGYALLWVAALLQPDWSADGNTYHIPTLFFWYRRGYIHWITQATSDLFSAWVNGYPKGIESIAFVLVCAAGSLRAANAVNPLFLAFGALGVYVLARKLGASSPSAIISAAVYPLLPMNAGQTATTYVDSAFASCVIVFSAMFSLTMAEIIETRLHWATAIMLGLTAGLMLGAKSVALPIYGMGALVLLGCCVICRSRTDFVKLSVALIVSLLLGGGWYARDYLHTGTPLYPVGLSLAGHTIFPGLSINEVTKEEINTPVEIRGFSAPEKVFYTWMQGLEHWPQSIIGFDMRLGGLGFIWLLGCVPALVWGIWFFARHRNTKGIIFFCLLLINIISFLCMPTNWWSRFTLWIIGLGLAMLALAFDHAWNSRSTSKRLWIYICIFIWAVEALITVSWRLSYIVPDGWKALRREGLGALAHISPSAPAPDYIFPQFRNTPFQTILHEDAPVAIGPSMTPPRDRIVGLFCYPLKRRELILLKANTSESDLMKLQESGVKYVIWDEELVKQQMQNNKWNGKLPIAHAGGFYLFE